MSRINQLKKYKLHLEERYRKLVERSKDYKHVDESKSDVASFKAMKILRKINQLRYLEN